MGTIKRKDANENERSWSLRPEEYNYVLAINQAKLRVAQEYTNVQSAFLNYIAKTRMGYEEKQDLQFELDFADESHTLKITKLT